jgi:hypothetical protein
MATKKEVQKEQIKCIKITVSNDQQTVSRELITMETDDMVVIMPHLRVMTFKKRLYWLANILYRHWDK